MQALLAGRAAHQVSWAGAELVQVQGQQVASGLQGGRKASSAGAGALLCQRQQLRPPALRGCHLLTQGTGSAGVHGCAQVAALHVQHSLLVESLQQVTEAPGVQHHQAPPALLAAQGQVPGAALMQGGLKLDQLPAKQHRVLAQAHSTSAQGILVRVAAAAQPCWQTKLAKHFGSKMKSGKFSQISGK